MRMIESVDSVVARSGEDLWAEICSCLPHPEQKDTTDAFTDSFTDSYAEGGSQGRGSDAPSQTNPKPWAPLNDSEVYLASLGECLKMLLSGKSRVKRLSVARFLVGEEGDSTLEHLKRWLQPDKVAINTEEVQCLIPPEPRPEKQESEEEPPAAEQ
ncbi:hypothetical protein llap_14292 [Limosa lapponica baueri]|uniref:Uncharacterized protein n=1 Tax=Limosa lapponica baueri TaxID=1758121 RepID=A0A2I0TNM1_LIMLA|nr:hypothetical protein llap_14292 [Limosa lapponica baueri]